jgi:hypothetical protein
MVGAQAPPAFTPWAVDPLGAQIVCPFSLTEANGARAQRAVNAGAPAQASAPLGVGIVCPFSLPALLEEP